MQEIRAGETLYRLPDDMPDDQITSLIESDQRALKGVKPAKELAPLTPAEETASTTPARMTLTKGGQSKLSLAPYETALTPDEEQRFQEWKRVNAPEDSGVDYDLRGAFKAGLTPAANGHWPDTYKKPNHPTFSDESIYAKDRPELAGHWEGETYVPPQPTAPLMESVKAAPAVARAATGAMIPQAKLTVLDAEVERLGKLRDYVQSKVGTPYYEPEYVRLDNGPDTERGFYLPPGATGSWERELREIDSQLNQATQRQGTERGIESGFRRDIAEAIPKNQGFGGKVVTTAAASLPSTLAGIAGAAITKSPAVGIALGSFGGGVQQGLSTYSETVRAGEEARRRQGEFAGAEDKSAYIKSVLADPEASDPLRTEAQRVSGTLATIEQRLAAGEINSRSADAMRERAYATFGRTVDHVAKNATYASARLGAFIQGAEELLGERIGLGAILRAAPLAQRLFHSAASVFSQEFATQLMQTLDDYLRYNPTITLKEALDDALLAGASGVLTAGAVAPATSAMQVAGERAALRERERGLDQALHERATRVASESLAGHGPSSWGAPLEPERGTRADLAAVMGDERPLEEIRQEQARAGADQLAGPIAQTAQGDAEAAAEDFNRQRGRAAALGVPEPGAPAIARSPTGQLVRGTVLALEFNEAGEPEIRLRGEDGELYIVAPDTGWTLAEQPTGEGTPASPVIAENAAAVEAAGERAVEPKSAEQAQAGNYRKGHVDLQGLDITIENPKGSTRSDKSNTPPKWSITMNAHYGYVKRSEGADGDQVDVYIGDNPQSDRVYIVDQINPETGEFDEHKAMLGYDSPEAARASYVAHFSDASGPARAGALTEMSMAEFKEWLKRGDTTKPLAYVQPAKQKEAANAAPAGQEQSSQAGELRRVPPRSDVRPYGGEVRKGEGGEANGGGGAVERPATPEPGGEAEAPWGLSPIPVRGQGKVGTINGRLASRFKTKVLEALVANEKTSPTTRANAQRELDRRAELAGRPKSKKRLAAEQRRKRIDPRSDTLLAAIAKLGGISSDYQEDITGDVGRKSNRLISGVGQVFRPTGLSPDEAATQLLALGYMTNDEIADVDGGVAALSEKIREELRGARTHYSNRNERYMREQQEREDELAKERAERDDKDARAALSAEGAKVNPVTIDVAKVLADGFTVLGPDRMDELDELYGDLPEAEFAAKIAKEMLDVQELEAAGSGENAGEEAFGEPGAPLDELPPRLLQAIPRRPGAHEGGAGAVPAGNARAGEATTAEQKYRALNPDHWGNVAPTPIDPANIPNPTNGKELHADPEKTLVLIACSDTKLAEEAQAVDLYNGPMWQTLREHLGKISPERVLVLSAEHAWINGTTRLKPYNRRMSRERANELIRLGLMEGERLYQGERRTPATARHSPYQETANSGRTGAGKGYYRNVIMAGGELYRNVFHAIVAQMDEVGMLSDDVAIRETTGGIGDQRAQLGAYLRAVNGDEEVRKREAARAGEAAGTEGEGRLARRKRIEALADSIERIDPDLAALWRRNAAQPKHQYESDVAAYERMAAGIIKADAKKGKMPPRIWNEPEITAASLLAEHPLLAEVPRDVLEKIAEIADSARNNLNIGGFNLIGPEIPDTRYLKMQDEWHRGMGPIWSAESWAQRVKRKQAGAKNVSESAISHSWKMLVDSLGGAQATKSTADVATLSANAKANVTDEELARIMAENPPAAEVPANTTSTDWYLPKAVKSAAPAERDAVIDKLHKRAERDLEIATRAYERLREQKFDLIPDDQIAVRFGQDAALALETFLSLARSKVEVAKSTMLALRQARDQGGLFGAPSTEKASGNTPTPAPAAPPVAKNTYPNSVIREVRRRSDDAHLGTIIEPYDGTKEGAIAAAKRTTQRLQYEYEGASFTHSRTGATDENGEPKWIIDATSGEVYPMDSDEARIWLGDQQALARWAGKSEEKRRSELEAPHYTLGQETQPKPPIVRYRKEAAALERTLPAIPAGYTRLWRGNRPGEVGTASRYTDDLPGIAMPFRDAYKGPLSYVDVPTSDLPKYKNAGSPGEYNLPAEIAARAATVGPSPEQTEAKRRSELEAPHFTLAAETQPKPQGVQGDLVGAEGLTEKPKPTKPPKETPGQGRLFQPRSLPEYVYRVVTPESIDASDSLTHGPIADVRDGVFIAYHLTDDPTHLRAALQSGRPLTEGRGDDAYGDLGKGLYVSGIPQYWGSRSVGKWDFLGRLTPAERGRIADKLASDPNVTGAQKGYYTESERERVVTYIERFRKGEDTYASLLAGQPYNLNISRPSFLKDLGIEPGTQPRVVEVGLRGKFVELKRNIDESEAENLRARGFDGAMVKMSMGSTAQTVVWNPGAVSILGEERAQLGAPRAPEAGPKPLPPMTGEEAQTELEAAQREEAEALAVGETRHPVQIMNRVKKLARAIGGMSRDEVRKALRDLETDLQYRRYGKPSRPRSRGYDWLKERLTRAVRRQELTPEQYAIGMWLLDKNPFIADDLGISLRTAPPEENAAAFYEPVKRIAVYFKGAGNDETVAHEILHHTERMMPLDVQLGIWREWASQLRQLFDAAITADNENLQILVLEAIRGATGDTEANNNITDAVANGQIPQDFYQYTNPSEFWAVNASRIIARRANAPGWIGRARTWLREFIEKVKEVFGLPSDAAVLRGLRVVLNSTGGQRSPLMLEGVQRHGKPLVLNAALQVTGKGDQTETPAFKKWFGKSKVVDAAGKPLVVYHGTAADFTTFSKELRGSKTGAADARHAFFFSSNPNAAEQFTWNEGEKSGSIMPVYLRMERPFTSDHLLAGATGTEVGKIIAQAKRDGYDGVIFPRTDMLGHGGFAYAVFEPEQIKSVFNRGTFSPTDANILKQVTPKGPTDEGAFIARREQQLLDEEERDMERMMAEARATRLHDLYERVINDVIPWFKSILPLARKVKALEAAGVGHYGNQDTPWLLGQVDDLWTLLEKVGDEAIPEDGNGVTEPAGRIVYANNLIANAKALRGTLDDGLKSELAAVADARAKLNMRSKYERADAKAIDAVLNNVVSLEDDLVRQVKQVVGPREADRIGDDGGGAAAAELERQAPDFHPLVDMGRISKTFVHPRTIAAWDGDFAPVHRAALGQWQHRDRLASQLTDEMKPYHDLSWAERKRVDAVLERGRLYGRIYGRGREAVAAEDPDRKAAIQPGETIRLNDAEKSAYWSVRRAMDKALDMLRDQIIEEHGLDPARVRTPQQVLDAIQAGMPAAEKRQLEWLAETVGEMQQAKRTGYVPFSRFGEYAIAVTKEDAEGRKTVYLEYVEQPSIDFHRKRGAAAAMKRWEALSAQYPAAQGFEVHRPFQVVSRQAGPSVDLGALDQLARIARIDPAEWDTVSEQLKEAVKKRGFRKHFIASSNVPGYSVDFERALADYTVGLSGYLARRKFAPVWDQAIGAIPAEKPRLAKYAADYRRYLDNQAEEFQTLRQLGYLYYIAGLPITAGVNLTQVPLITAPYLAQFTNPARVSVQLARAYKAGAQMLSREAAHPTRSILGAAAGAAGGAALLGPAGATLGGVMGATVGIQSEKIFNPAQAPEDVRPDFQRSWDEGFFVPLATIDTMGLAHNRSLTLRKLSRASRETIDALANMFTVAERENRIVTWIAAYRIAQMPGMREKILRTLQDNALSTYLAEVPPADFARHFAEWTVDDTQFRMGKVNRATVMRNWGAPIVQFKSFSWQSIELYARLAALQGWRGRVALAAALLALLLTSGVWGLPFAGSIRDLIEALYKKFTDIDIDLKLELRRFVTELTGSPRIAEMAGHGLLRGIDWMPEVSGRIGQGDILPSLSEPVQWLGIPADLLYKRTLGPGGFLEKFQRGEYQAAAAQLAPNFLKNAIEAAAWRDTGVRTQKTGAKLVHEEKLEQLDILLKAAGARSRKVAELEESEITKNRASGLTSEAARAYRFRLGLIIANRQKAEDKGDTAAAAAWQAREDEIWATLEAYNKDRPVAEQIIVTTKAAKEAADRELLGPQARDKRAPRQARERRQEIEELYNQPF